MAANNIPVIQIDTPTNPDLLNEYRMSCVPNMHLRRMFNPDGTIGHTWAPARDLLNGEERTIPFHPAYLIDQRPLVCAIHIDNMDACPKEQERRQNVGEN